MRGRAVSDQQGMAWVSVMQERAEPDDQGKLIGAFVAYTHTPTMFGGFRKWFACPGCLRPARVL